jgi:hypothetical protein
VGVGANERQKEVGMYQPEEVINVKHGGLIKEEFIKAYEKRYHVKPVIEAEDLAGFEFIAKTLGLERGRAVVIHYVKMNDEWFLKTMHKTKNLRQDLNKINASLGLKQGTALEGDGLRIKTILACDKCFMPFEWIGNPTEIGRASYRRLCNIHKPSESLP